MHIIRSVFHILLNIFIVAIVPIHLGFDGKNKVRGFMVLALYTGCVVGMTVGFFPAYIISGIFILLVTAAALYLSWEAVKKNNTSC